MADWQISKGETDLAIRIMREVAQWCIEVGHPMWTLQELTREALLSRSRSEEDFRVARLDGELSAAMILQWEDPLFWPDVPRGGSGFIHKLCVRRAFAGKNLSARMVAAAVDECRNRNAAFLRLDTNNRSPRLRALYEGLGFMKVGRRLVDGRDYALYELPIAAT